MVNSKVLLHQTPIWLTFHIKLINGIICPVEYEIYDPTRGQIKLICFKKIVIDAYHVEELGEAEAPLLLENNICRIHISNILQQRVYTTTTYSLNIIYSSHIAYKLRSTSNTSNDELN